MCDIHHHAVHSPGQVHLYDEQDSISNEEGELDNESEDSDVAEQMNKKRGSAPNFQFSSHPITNVEQLWLNRFSGFYQS